MKNRLEYISNFINEKIISFCDSGLFEEERCFYAEAFAVTSLEKSGKLSPGIEKYLLGLYKNKNKDEQGFHHEFNNYALLHSENGKKLLDNSLRVSSAEATNWTILRERCFLELDNKYSLDLIKKTLKYNQLDNGLVKDAPWDNSFQYHCFSLSLVGECLLIQEDKELRDIFRKGVEFILPFISPTGETTFIGRGQNQSFGYSSLLYLLTLSQNILNINLVNEIDRVVSLIERQLQKYKDLPLVLDRDVKGRVDLDNPDYLGWYQYNNYLDYLCFSSYFLTKAMDFELFSSDESLELGDYTDIHFKVVKRDYFAVISSIGGYWTNDLPIPFIQYEGSNILPIYGGEQFGSDLYQFNDIPLPINKLVGKSIRKRCSSIIKENTLIVKSLLGRMNRHFKFKKKSIEIETDIAFPFLFKTPYFFLVGTEVIDEKTLKYLNVEFHFSKKIRKKEKRFSVSGELIHFEIDGSHHLEIKFL